LIYQAFFRLVLQRIDSERAHALAIAFMRLYARIPGAVALSDRLLRPRPTLRVEALGLQFRSPLGLAAGVDKNSTAFEPLAALGFGSVEVGTVTNRPQPGNPRPRVWRLPKERALLNAMGFPNSGADAQARRLCDRRHTAQVIGVNIGKSRDVSLEDDFVLDYREATRKLAGCAQYLALNVSSPNTPGLRSMQTSEHLRALVGGVRAELTECGHTELPLLIKLGPNLTDEEIVELAQVALEIRVDGIIAVNTTTDYDSVPACRAEIAAHGDEGGISGRPLKARALEVLQLLHAQVEGMPLISVGGIETAEDAWQRLLAGATLVQAHTAFVYGGPLWPRRVNRGLARLLEDSPWSSIEEAVGGGGTGGHASNTQSVSATPSPRAASRSTTTV
jgi:dihydroorotate dehydrogenase